MQKEEAQVGSVAADVYSTYIQAAGGWCLAITVLVGVLVGQGQGVKTWAAEIRKDVS